MSGDRALAIFVVGAAVLVASLALVGGNPSGSWIPTLVYMPGLMLVLVGQLWFLGAFAEAPEASPVAAVMFVVLCAPLVGAVARTWGTPYGFIRWTALAVIVLEALLFAVFFVGGGVQKSGGARPRPKPKLPG